MLMAPHLALLLSFLLHAFAHGQSTGPEYVVKGCLVDRTSGDQLMFATVVLINKGDTSVADIHGCIELHLQDDPLKGREELLFHLLGFVDHTCRIKRRDLTRGRTHRLKQTKFTEGIPVTRAR